MEALKNACIQSVKELPEELKDDFERCKSVLEQCYEAERGNWWTLLGLYGLGELILCKRYTANVTQRQAAKHIGIAQSRFCDIENEDFMDMRLKDIIKLCELIGLNLKIDVIDSVPAEEDRMFEEE